MYLIASIPNRSLRRADIFTSECSGLLGPVAAAVFDRKRPEDAGDGEDCLTGSIVICRGTLLTVFYRLNSECIAILGSVKNLPPLNVIERSFRHHGKGRSGRAVAGSSEPPALDTPKPV